MKYQELKQIATYLKTYPKLHSICRLDNNLFELHFSKDTSKKESLIFDLNRSKSGIYKSKITALKSYNAPFDNLLKKYFNNALIKEITVLENNRIIVFQTKLLKSYKSYENKIYFEFTGKNTNVIITDEKELILGALRYIDKSYRIIKAGQKLEPLKAFEMDTKGQVITDFQSYFKNEALRLNENKLNSLKANKKALLAKKIANLQEKLRSLASEEELKQKAKDYALRAELLLANLYTLKDYERKFSLCDYEGKKLYFELENSPKYSANELFKQAKKAKQKASNLTIQRQNLQEKLDFLLKLQKLVDEASTSIELEILVHKKSLKEKKEGLNTNIAFFYMQDFKICLGKNETGNIFLLKNAKKDDIWLHVKDYPSPHVFIVSNKTNIKLEVLEFAAKLCVNFSNLNKGSFIVDYTSRKFVKIKQKAFVDYTNYKSLSVVKE